MEQTTYETALKMGLLKEEFDKIKETLGRTPNFAELSIFSVMWSEHCSYKNSILWLKKLPKSSPRMLAEAGEENAGLVDIGNGLACSFKIESHNHPSAIEPYQGAATGVGGINRDIFSMGARPIAQLNSLRFGNPKLDKTRWLVKGVVKGIGDYGNAFGVPTVGGEVFFDDSYNINPLVNAFSAGIVKHNRVGSAIATGVGNPVFIVGSATGKDGIHGATFASGDITEESANDLPSVQVGDPFQEKLLLEATLELLETGTVVGLQDMGAAGITCSTSEMSAKGEHGMEIWLDKVPTRQADMKDFEILLSESQERMLIVVEKGTEETIKSIFEKWDMYCEQIGEVIKDEKLVFHQNGEIVAEVPTQPLVLGGGAPVYERDYEEPPYYQEYKKFDIETIEEPDGKELSYIAKFLLQHPNIASKRWVSEQYDSMVGTANSSTNAPSDAAVVNVKGTDKNLLFTLDCNSRYVNADPEQGCAIAVAEAARNIVCTGGEPVAITNCLNFGNPYVPQVYWQFVSAIKGMKKACEKFGTPVTGGNVSFYNQSTDEGPVFPAPTIGMLGLMEGLDKRMTPDFKKPGDIIYLVGESQDCIGSSEYLYSYHHIKESPAPYFDLEEEMGIHKLVTQLIEEKAIQSAHDVSDGGLFIALAESAIAGQVGFDVVTSLDVRKDSFLFGEAQGRVLVSVKPEDENRFIGIVEDYAYRIGKVATDSQLRVDGLPLVSISDATFLHENGLGHLMEADS